MGGHQGRGREERWDPVGATRAQLVACCVDARVAQGDVEPIVDEIRRELDEAEQVYRALVVRLGSEKVNRKVRELWTLTPEERRGTRELRRQLLDLDTVLRELDEMLARQDGETGER